jgi:hypothetical protein
MQPPTISDADPTAGEQDDADVDAVVDTSTRHF